MTAEQRLRFASDEYDRAQRDTENALLAWRIAKSSAPREYALAEMEVLCAAVEFEADARRCFLEAQMDAQAEWVEITRRAEAGSFLAGTPAFARRAIAEAPAQQVPPQAQPSPDAVARTQYSRED